MKKLYIAILAALTMVAWSAQAEEAKVNFDKNCAACHGKDGRGTPEAKKLEPPPTDFTVYNLLPERAFEVISNGYPGTMMVSYSNLPEGIRWGLVKIVNDKSKF